MGTLYIQEYEQMARDPSGHLVPVGLEPALASQVIDTNATTSAQCAALNEATKFVRLVATNDMRVAFGTDPTADGDSMAIEESQAEYFGVRVPGMKIAALEAGL